MHSNLRSSRVNARARARPSLCSENPTRVRHPVWPSQSFKKVHSEKPHDVLHISATVSSNAFINFAPSVSGTSVCTSGSAAIVPSSSITQNRSDRSGALMYTHTRLLSL